MNYGKDGWICTGMVRFVERDVLLRKEGPYEVCTKEKVLQQFWTPANGYEKSEWRDVPTVTVEAEHV